MTKLDLPTVTLCAATSVNTAATVAALRACLDKVAFADCLLFTSSDIVAGSDVRIVPIDPLQSARDYSHFILRRLGDYIRTPHCLIVQWDGFVLDAGSWDPRFLDFDYIGAPWPQFGDFHAVGNGGFSLRSGKLLRACQDPEFQISHPEDVAVCRINRPFLELRHGIRFADPATAENFAFERSWSGKSTFGFHGIFNMIPVLGADRFWKSYRSLDDPSTAWVDFRTLLHQVGTGRRALRRRARLGLDRLRSLFRS